MENLLTRVNVLVGSLEIIVKHRIIVIIKTATTMANVRVETLIIPVNVNRNIAKQTVS